MIFGRQRGRGCAVYAAVEMIHAYSLIHMICRMDDDNLRRGKPTNHKVLEKRWRCCREMGCKAWPETMLTRV
ncbi:MAG: polyprenyl synthetase family protein [Christensenellales bacterium]